MYMYGLWLLRLFFFLNLFAFVFSWYMFIASWRVFQVHPTVRMIVILRIVLGEKGSGGSLLFYPIGSMYGIFT